MQESEDEAAPGARHAATSAAVHWKLLDRLYAPNSVVALSAFQAAVTGVLLWSRTEMAWPMVWTVASILLLGARVRLGRFYRQCSEDDDPEIWARRFTIGAWTSSALWGGLGILIVLCADPVVHLIVVGAQWSHLSAVFNRNSSEPRAAFGQVCLVKAPLALACFATGNPVYAIYGATVALGILIARSSILSSHRQIVELLEANEQLAASRDQLEGANRRLETLATTDALTSLTNRRGFDVAFRREWRRAARCFQPVSLLLLDLDYFKKLNDILGHTAGDDCLARVGRCIQASVRRPADVATRYGGEEFAIILPDTDPVAARMMAERIRIAIATLRIPHPGSPMGIVTASVGAATALPDEMLSAALLIEQADAALYRAKGSGRNCTEVAAPLPLRLVPGDIAGARAA